MTPMELLQKVNEWNARAVDAFKALNDDRATLLKEAKRLKMLAAVKALLVLPRVGEPVAAEAPGPFPTTPSPDLAILPAPVRK